PRFCKGTNLKIAASQGRTYLYLSTYGWGVFRADITPRRSVKIRIPRRELIRKLVPIIEQRLGIEIREGDIFPTDHSTNSYQLAVATLIQSLSEEMSTHNVETVKLQDAAYSLAQKLARQSIT